MPVLFFLAFLTASSCYAQAQVLEPKEFAKQIKNSEVLVIDVRAPEEYKEGALPRAINVEWGNQFEKHIPSLPKVPIYIYCLKGVRSHKAAALLRQKGYKQVYELNGGLSAWREAQLPITK